MLPIDRGAWIKFLVRLLEMSDPSGNTAVAPLPLAAARGACVTESTRAGPRREFFTGARDQLPLLLGVVPFGLIFGALAVSAGIPAFEAQAFSFFIFAGSAQFVAIGLVAGQTPALLIVATILVVNLRHMLYSAALGPHVQHLSLRWKVPLAWLLTDEAFATASLRYRRDDREHAHWYFLGTGLTLWAFWQLSTLLGIALGRASPRAGRSTSPCP